MFIALSILWLMGIVLTLHLFALLAKILARRSQRPLSVNYLDHSHRHKVPTCTFWRNRFNLRIYNHPVKISRAQRLWEILTGFTVMVEIKPFGAILTDVDDFGALWSLHFSNNTSVCMIHVINSTPEPDGSYSEYDIRVPNTVSSAQQAVAWTFGFQQWTAYKPRVQT